MGGRGWNVLGPRGWLLARFAGTDWMQNMNVGVGRGADKHCWVIGSDRFCDSVILLASRLHAASNSFHAIAYTCLLACAPSNILRASRQQVT